MKWFTEGAAKYLCLPFGDKPTHAYKLKHIQYWPNKYWFYLWDIGDESKHPSPENIGVDSKGETWYTRMKGY